MAAQLSFTGFVWKNLWRRRLRTLLTLCGIGMAIGAFVGLVGFSRAFEQEWLRIYSSSGTDIAVIQETFLNTSVDESAAATLKALPIVEQATPMIYNVMDLTPEVNALAFGWKADSYEFGSLQSAFGTALPRRPAGGDAGRPVGRQPEEENRRHAGDSRLAVHGGRDLPWRLGAGGRRGDPAPGPVAATQQPAGQSVDDPCAAAAGACGRTSRTSI